MIVPCELCIAKNAELAKLRAELDGTQSALDLLTTRSIDLTKDLNAKLKAAEKAIDTWKKEEENWMTWLRVDSEQLAKANSEIVEMREENAREWAELICKHGDAIRTANSEIERLTAEVKEAKRQAYTDAANIAHGEIHSIGEKRPSDCCQGCDTASNIEYKLAEKAAAREGEK